jgi:hypothetical protein
VRREGQRCRTAHLELAVRVGLRPAAELRGSRRRGTGQRGDPEQPCRAAGPPPTGPSMALGPVPWTLCQGERLPTADVEGYVRR